MSSRSSSEKYSNVYLPWATRLVNSEPAIELIEQAQTDWKTLNNTSLLFRPPLERLSSELGLPSQQKLGESEEIVQVTADFRASILDAITISSLKKYSVALRPQSEQWPVQYSDEKVRKSTTIVFNEELRELAEQTVIRTGKALQTHKLHRVPIGNVPEEDYELSINESELKASTKKCSYRGWCDHVRRAWNIER